MRKISFSFLLFVVHSSYSQNNTSAAIIEGSKVLVDLIRVFKTPKNSFVQPATNTVSTDSCGQKNIADICYKNTSGNVITVSLFKRNGTVYANALSLKIINNGQECLYELPAGIYKYKVETENGNPHMVINEGELKLNSCDKLVNEIKSSK
jgi:hypothetical protein